MRSKTTIPLALAALALGAGAAPASAQDALGQGDALDASLNTTGRTNLPAAREDFRLRNLLVTDSVAGGRGFRGSVGYTAPTDFRGDLGSDEIYPFLRESAFSSAQFLSYGNTFQQLRFGQDMGLLEYRRGFVGASPDTVGDPAFTRTGRDDAAIRQLDRLAISSSIDGRNENAGAPLAMGRRFTQDSFEVVQGSSLQGVYAVPDRGNILVLGLTNLDLAHVQRDLAEERMRFRIGAGFDEQFLEAFRPMSSAGRGTSAPSADRLDGRTDYRMIADTIAERLRERAGLTAEDLAADPESLSTVLTPYDQIRARLFDAERDAAAADDPASLAPPSQTPAPGGDVLQLPGPERNDDGGGGDDDEEEGPSIMETEAILELLRHGQEIKTLAGDNENRFNDLLRDGEAFLRAGEYFKAERRFDHALRFTPGHPMALVGLAHAQIGAGLYPSAAASLRDLYTRRPEMIDARFDAGLLPERRRVRTIIDELRERMRSGSRPEGYALLLAYIGHQIEDRVLVTQGIDRIAVATPEDPMLPVLKGLWADADGEDGEGVPVTPEP